MLTEETTETFAGVSAELTFAGDQVADAACIAAWKTAGETNMSTDNIGGGVGLAQHLTHEEGERQIGESPRVHCCFLWPRVQMNL
jgi:hypothetical protein